MAFLISASLVGLVVTLVVLVDIRRMRRQSQARMSALQSEVELTARILEKLPRQPPIT